MNYSCLNIQKRDFAKTNFHTSPNTERENVKNTDTNSFTNISYLNQHLPTQLDYPKCKQKLFDSLLLTP
jgi:hypothetical protein